MNGRGYWQAGASVAAMFFGATAQAQTASPPPPPATAVTELVVTAERRAENVQTVPIAATVVTGALLKNKNIFTVDTLQFTVPSLAVNNFGLGYDFNIRGIGKEEGNIQTPSGVVVYRDGVATFPGFFQDEPYYDLANIEVLRGPQGTFAGQNATGGAIFITEVDPTLKNYNGFAEVQAGAYADVRLRGAVNIPLGDTAAVRIATNLERADSVWSHPLAGGDAGHIREADGRISFLWQPTPALRILFKNDYHHLETGGIPVSPVPLTGGNYADNTGLFDAVNNGRLLGIETTDRSVLNISYTLPDGIVLRSISGYQIGRGASNTDIDGTPIESAYFAVIGKEHIWSEEVNIISPDTGRIRWVLGGYYQDDTVRIPFGYNGFDIHEPPLDILLDYTTPKTTEAAFGQISFEVSPKFEIVAGARYTHSDFKLDDATTLGLCLAPMEACPPNPDLILGTEVAHFDQPDSKVTGKVSFNWRLNEDNFLYAMVATGHKPGGVNTTPLPFGVGNGVVPFRPEDLVDYEVGWKPTFYDGHLRMQLDAFYTPYQNFQLTYAGQGGQAVAGGMSVIQNVPGTTQVWGLEAEGQGVFGPWAFDFGASYLHARLSHSAGMLGGPSGVEDVGGAIQPYAPDWTLHAGAQYAIRLANGQTITPRIDYAHIADQWASPFQHNELDAEFFHLRPVNLVNAEITWDAGHGFTVTAYGANLLDEHYFAVDIGYTQIPNNPPTTPATLRYYRIAAAPIEGGIRLAKSF
ncbi:MAG TPA: TonB-dependent receptor [Caulobacteraceae bacterium]|nr:TonB-dependent receptor [Caulobacteraceae bacterium]